MSQKKKKKARQNLQKISKAKQRNDFTARFKSFLNQAAGQQIFQLMPPEEIETIHKARYLPVRVQPAFKQNIPPAIRKDAQVIITALFKINKLNMEVGDLSEISFHDFFSIGVTAIMYAITLKEDAYGNAKTVKEALIPLADFGNSPKYTKAWDYYFGAMNTMALMNSNLTANLYTLKFETRTYPGGIPGLCFCMEIYSLQTEKMQFTINENNRPAYRVAWYFSEPSPHLQSAKVKQEEIGLPSGSFLDVYIQAHALNRLNERIDGIDTGLLHFSLFESFKNIKVCKNKKGDLLFEYRITGNKTGYFKGDIIDGKLILRTFLFLTNNDTPEGEKLHVNTGIMKEDKIYLTIDKLSTFVNSDIAANDRVKEIFIKADCEDLFKIDRNFYFSSEAKKERSIADQIAKYLNSNNYVARGNNKN